MNIRILAFGSTLVAVAAIALAQRPHGTSHFEERNGIRSVDTAYLPSAAELRLRDSANTGLQAYSGIQSANSRPARTGTDNALDYGAF